MNVRVKALQSFSGLEGLIKRGREFRTSEHRAAYLVSRGIAERLDSPSVTETPEPEAAPTAGPTSTKVDEPVHVGGGWYEWNGKRYRGKDAALAARG